MFTMSIFRVNCEHASIITFNSKAWFTLGSLCCYLVGGSCIADFGNYVNHISVISYRDRQSLESSNFGDEMSPTQQKPSSHNAEFKAFATLKTM